MDAQIAFSYNPDNLDVIIILETACQRSDTLWSCSDNYTAHYLASENKNAKKHIKIYILLQVTL